MLTIVILFTIICTLIAATFVVAVLALNVKEAIHQTVVARACNRNTQHRLAEVLRAYTILHLKAEALSEDKDRIARITKAVARSVKEQQAEAAQQISYLSCENENLKEEIEGRWQTIDFLRETISELKDTVAGQDSLVVTLQERNAVFADMILELYEELDTMHKHANMPVEDDQEAASLEAAANKLRRAQYRAEKTFLRSVKQARQEANRVSKG